MSPSFRVAHVSECLWRKDDIGTICGEIASCEVRFFNSSGQNWIEVTIKRSLGTAMVVNYQKSGAACLAANSLTAAHINFDSGDCSGWGNVTVTPV